MAILYYVLNKLLLLSLQIPNSNEGDKQEDDEQEINNYQNRNAISTFDDGSSPGETEEDKESTFDSLFQSFSKQWMHAQLTHKVSLAASSAFWLLSFKYVSKNFELKNAEKKLKKIPQFLQARKNMYTEICPRIKMTFAFLNKTDGSIIHVDAEKTPLNAYQRDPKYQKLYEEARIEVNKFPIRNCFY